MPSDEVQVRPGDSRGRRSPELWALFGILVAGALVRGLYLGELAQNPDYTSPGVDAGFHQYWAEGLVTGDWTPPRGDDDPQVSTTPFLRPPGYPYFLALIYKLGGTGALWPRVVQMSLGLFNCLLAFAVGRRWYGRAVGVIWSGFMSLYWSFVYFEGELHATTALITLLLVSVYLLGRWMERLSIVHAAVAGGLLGVASLLRPNALPLVPVVALWMLAVAGRRSSVRQGCFAAGALVLAAVVAVAPATIRNALVAGDFVLISANGGINLYIGNNEEATGHAAGIIPGLGRFHTPYDYPALVATLERRLGVALTYSEVSSHFCRRAVEFMRTHPLKFLRLTVTKALLFWGPTEVANNKELHYERKFSEVLSRLPGSFPVVLALAVPGACLLLLRRRECRGEAGAAAGRAAQQRGLSLLIGVIIVALFLAILPFFVAGRYRVPIIAFLLLFAAQAVCGVIQLLAARRWRATALWAVGGALGYAAFSTPFVPLAPQLSRWYFDRGLAYERVGDEERALRHYERALEVDPAFALVRLAAARVLRRSGRLEDAATHLRRTLQDVHPYAADAHYLLGHVLVEQGRREQALTHYREALRIRPEFVQARLELALLLRDLGRAAEAIDEYELLRIIDPEDVNALFWMGLTLRDAGRINEANRCLRQALEREPQRRVLLQAMGIEFEANMPAVEDAGIGKAPALGVEELVRRADRFAVTGRTRDAISSYRMALAREPDDGVVRFKLAEVLAAGGRLEEATEEYQQALEADPSFAAAHVGLGIVLGRQNDAASAVRHYREAIRLDPDSLAAHYNLGIALGEGLGQYDEATEALRRALSLVEADGRADLAERITQRINRFRRKRQAETNRNAE